MTGAAFLLLVLALVAAVGDWWAVHHERPPLEYLCKPLTLALLVLAALEIDPSHASEGGVRRLYVVALVLCLIGDVLLMLPQDLFVPGLVAFLLGHLAYVAAFVARGIDVAHLGIGVVVVAVALAVLGSPILLAVRAGPEPEMAAPVLAYMVVISAMVASAFGAGPPLAVLGAGLFYVSDACIAWNRFVSPDHRGPTRHPRLAIITTYHAAQVLFVLSLA